MAEQTYQLIFSGPFYVGTWGIDRQKTLTYLPSDTLFGALVVAWQMMGVLPPKLEAMTLRLTSALPFAGPVRFFPRPLNHIELPSTIKPKAIKKVEWVSEEIFNKVRQSGQVEADLAEPNFLQGGNIWLTRPERENLVKTLQLVDDPDDPAKLVLWRQDIVPRVTVDRRDSGSNLFFTGRLKFVDTPRPPETHTSHQACGLWFAVRGNEAEIGLVEAGLNYLQDSGMGGLRSTGHGGFTWRPWDNAAALPQPADNDSYFVSLARFAPTEETFAPLQAPHSAYKLVTVRGWCQDDSGHPWRRKQVRLVAEGAYLAWPGQTPGQLVDVTPTTPEAAFNGRKVYRYGWAFPVKAG